MDVGFKFDEQTTKKTDSLKLNRRSRLSREVLLNLKVL